MCLDRKKNSHQAKRKSDFKNNQPMLDSFFMVLYMNYTMIYNFGPNVTVSVEITTTELIKAKDGRAPYSYYYSCLTSERVRVPSQISR